MMIKIAEHKPGTFLRHGTGDRGQGREVIIKLDQATLYTEVTTSLPQVVTLSDGYAKIWLS